MMITCRNSRQPQRQGVVLLAVLVVVVVLTLAAYQFSDLMVAEYKAADSYTRSIQARALARSGVYYAAALLSSPDNLSNILSSNPYDNSGSFQGVLVQQTTLPASRAVSASSPRRTPTTPIPARCTASASWTSRAKSTSTPCSSSIAAARSLTTS
jgi:hypothetical protein